MPAARQGLNLNHVILGSQSRIVLSCACLAVVYIHRLHADTGHACRVYTVLCFADACHLTVTSCNQTPLGYDFICACLLLCVAQVPHHAGVLAGPQLAAGQTPQQSNLVDYAAQLGIPLLQLGVDVTVPKVSLLTSHSAAACCLFAWCHH